MVALGLTACGGGGGGGFALGGNPFAASESLAASSVDTMTASIERGDGVSGVISLAEVGISGSSAGLGTFRVDVANDGESANVRVGGSTYNLPLLEEGATYRRFGSESGTLLQMNEAGTNQLATFSQSGGSSGISGFGYLGIETPIDQLPTGDVIYNGTWGGQAYNTTDIFDSGVIGGFMQYTVNFSGGTLTGSFDGDLNAASTPEIAGTISGSASGNGIQGTMNITSGATGSFDMAGNAYGYSGTDLNGAVAGYISSGGQTYAVGGTFNSDND